MALSDVCLDVAIDHRIRHLLKTKPAYSTDVNSSHGTHVQKLQQLHPFVHGRPDGSSHEIVVTEELAQPLSQGGFVVALLQPAKSHPFSDGVDVVVETSPTLRALRDVFSLIGLDLVEQVTVLDSFPFLQKVNKKETSASDEKKYRAALDEHHEVFLEAVVAKHPDVVLCMWQNREKRRDTWSGSKIESLGVGKSFDYEKVTLYDRHGNRTETQRVNVFHPSYCMNYHPRYSRLRQLLILEVAHAWHLTGPGWQEEPWMTKLRESCKKKAKQLVNEQNEELYVIYANALTKIQDLIPELALSKDPREQRPKLLYDKLVAANWTEHMNDAALCLKQAQKYQRDLVSVHNTMGPQGDMALRTFGLLLSVATKLGKRKMEPRVCHGNSFFGDEFLKHLQHERRTFLTSEEIGPWFENRILKGMTLKKSMIDFLLDLDDSFLDETYNTSTRGPLGLQMSLVSASKAFLTMARRMEGLLGTLAGYLREEGMAVEDMESSSQLAVEFETLTI